MEGKEGKEEKEPMPEEWAEIPIQDYFDKGFRPNIKTVGNRKYITLKKGSYEKSLGPYDEEKWKLLNSMYPHRIRPFPSINSKYGNSEGMVPIDERIRELREKDLSNEEIVRIMYMEGYPTNELMRRGLPIRALGNETEVTDSGVMAAIQGPAGRGEGYLAELKTMIRSQISRTRELTELFYDVGLGVLLAALRKSGMKIDDYRKIALERGAIRDALKVAGDTAFKALEHYDSDAICKLEEERDEARVAYSLVAAQLKELTESLDPKVRLEKMIHTYLASGNVDASVLTTLIDKWLSIEVVGLKAGVMVP
jgi:hypothetical protein